LTIGPSTFQFDGLKQLGTAADLRQVAKKLNAIADLLEPGVGIASNSSIAVGHETAERRLPRLAEIAEVEYGTRRARNQYLGADLLGEPAWDILLDLLVQQGRGRRISVTSACLASGAPCSTALRWIAALEASGLVNRVAARHDKRVVFLELTRAAVEALDRSLVG
jgi:DNA-binding MarR family transcriptional regulator